MSTVIETVLRVYNHISRGPISIFLDDPITVVVPSSSILYFSNTKSAIINIMTTLLLHHIDYLSFMCHTDDDGKMTTSFIFHSGKRISEANKI